MFIFIGCKKAPEKPIYEDPIRNKRLRMLEGFIEDCRVDGFREYACVIYSKKAGFTDEEITRWSNH